MNDLQRNLARAALGFNSGKRKSYRNRFFVTPGTDGHRHWQEMAAQGWAVEDLRAGGLIQFSLTLAGAKLALKKGESLCGEDFPGILA